MVAVFYGALAAALWRRPEPGWSLLARAFMALAIIFATIAIPFAADPRWTSGWWALEAAAVYWIGCRQRQGFARAFALVLQVGAAVAFVAGGVGAGERMFLNATFLGTTMIALAALAHGVAGRPVSRRGDGARARVAAGAAGVGNRVVVRRRHAGDDAGAAVAGGRQWHPRLRRRQHRARAAAASGHPLAALAVVRRGLVAGDGRGRCARLGCDAHDAARVRLAGVAAGVARAGPGAVRGGPCAR